MKKLHRVHHVPEAAPSTLMLLGTKDPIVSVETIEAYQDKLLQKGVDCELHLFEGAGHPIFLYRKPLTEEYYKGSKVDG
ncbi:MAG: prolyl oligopeptidase family serine peptidase [Parabacteroides merdae]